MASETPMVGTVPTSPGDSLGSSLDSTVINERVFNTRKFYRMVISGRTVEVYLTDQPVITKRVLLKPPKKKKIIAPEDRTEENKAYSAHRTREKVRRLALANFDPTNSKHLVLTFADTEQFDITSPSECHPKLKYFLKKLRVKYPNFIYIGVGEFQTKRQVLAVHYHLLVNLPYIKKSEIQGLWGWGLVFIRKGSSNQVNKVSYITKYITKENGYRYKRRRYFTSHNLVKPITKYGDDARSLLKKMIKLGWSPTYKSRYHNSFLGETEYTEYNLPTKSPAQGSDGE